MPKSLSQTKIVRDVAEACPGGGNKIELEEINFNIALTKYLFSQLRHERRDS